MRIIGGNEHVLPDSTPYPAGEEEAFLQGVKSGRRAGVYLDFEMEFQAAEQAVLDWNPFAPRNDPFDLYCKTVLLHAFLSLGLIECLIGTIYPLLRGEPEMDFMLRLLSYVRDVKHPIQAFPNDMARIEEAMKQARLSVEENGRVVRVIRRYRYGQMKGLYWQWRLERLAFDERDSHKRASLFREAMLKKMPRVE
jgi:hypothetical protein